MDTSTPTLGLSLIARDEADNLPHLLASIEDAVDQVALLDTGSKDRTVDVFIEWAEGRQLPLGFRVDHFAWRYDFAAARNAADAMLDTDWLCWADCDDEILGAPALKSLVASAPLRTAALAFPYFWIPGFQPGMRIRMARRGAARWHGRVHERPVFNIDRAECVVAEAPVWGHRVTRSPDDWARASRRNLAILERWQRDEPGNPEVARLMMIERGIYREAVLAAGRSAAVIGG